VKEQVKYKGWLFLVILAVSSACVHFSGHSDAIFFATLNLDHQHDSSEIKADWAFRRERLRYFISLLTESNPDVVGFQQALSRNSNPQDDDQKILQRSSLGQHVSASARVKKYTETYEEEALLTFSAYEINTNKQIEFADESHALLTHLQAPGGVVYLYNVGMKSPDALTKLFRLISTSRCLTRHVILGDFHGSFISKVIYENDFLDTAEEFCRDDCDTVALSNPIVKRYYPEFTALRRARILVHKDAIIESAGIQFSRTTNAPFILQRRDLNEIAVGPYWGWGSRVRLPRCD
jgi:endonuclease/exonuclease/phosphatase family metal-dependent hydrolase